VLFFILSLLTAVSVSAATCTSRADCQCNQHWQSGGDKACYKGGCFHVIADAKCKGVTNGQSYDGMQPKTFCHTGDSQRVSTCAAVPGPTCTSKADCQCNQHWQSGGDKVCHKGGCVHVIADAKCKDVPNTKSYDGMQPMTFCHDGDPQRVSTCTAVPSPQAAWEGNTAKVTALPDTGSFLMQRVTLPVLTMCSLFATMGLVFLALRRGPHEILMRSNLLHDQELEQQHLDDDLAN